jgi:hypothetical protein
MYATDTVVYLGTLSRHPSKGLSLSRERFGTAERYDMPAKVLVGYALPVVTVSLIPNISLAIRSV